MALDAFFDETQRFVSGEVRLRCEPGTAPEGIGTCFVAGRRSPVGLYDHDLATYTGGGPLPPPGRRGLCEDFRARHRNLGQQARAEPGRPRPPAHRPAAPRRSGVRAVVVVRRFAGVPREERTVTVTELRRQPGRASPVVAVV